jgi:hypothetical protein
VGKKKKDEPSKRSSDNEVKVSRSKNTQVAIGDNITQVQEAPKKPIPFDPYDDNELSLIGIGERLMRLFYGTYDHNLNWWTFFTVIASVLSFGAIGSPFVPNSPVRIGSQYYLPISLIGFAGFGLSSLFGWGPIGMAKQTECPKCHYKFRFFAVKKDLVNSKELSDEEVRHFKVKKKCKHCGFSKVFDRVEHKVYDTEDSR